MKWTNYFSSKKEQPQFWQDYKAKFKSATQGLVAFDCETTGLDPKSDRLLSIGAIRFSDERIYIAQSMELFIRQTDLNEETVAIHGIMPSDAAVAELSEKQAVIRFLYFIGNAKLVGHHIDFDVAMVNQALKKMGLRRLKNKTKDTNSLFKKKYYYPQDQNVSLDEVCHKFSIKASNRHTALGDAYITAVAYQRLAAM